MKDEVISKVYFYEARSSKGSFTGLFEYQGKHSGSVQALRSLYKDEYDMDVDVVQFNYLGEDV